MKEMIESIDEWLKSYKILNENPHSYVVKNP